MDNAHAPGCDCYSCEMQQHENEKPCTYTQKNRTQGSQQRDSVEEFRAIIKELQPLVNYAFEFLRSKNNVIHAFDNSHLNLREIEVCTNLLSVLNQNGNETRLTAHIKTELLQRISKQLGINEPEPNTTIKS